MNRESLKSFRELPPDFVKKPWVNWDTTGMTLKVLEVATGTLADWLQARMTDLHRERVNLDDIEIVHRGGRTVIRVCGADRFDFKLKITVGKA